MAAPGNAYQPLPRSPSFWDPPTHPTVRQPTSWDLPSQHISIEFQNLDQSPSHQLSSWVSPHTRQPPCWEPPLTAVVPQPPQPCQLSCGPPTSPHHSATAPLPSAAAVPPPVDISPPCSPDVSRADEELLEDEPPPPPQRSPSSLSITSNCHLAASLPTVAAIPSSNLPPTVPSCSPDDNSGEESGLSDELPPPDVISPSCSPCISGEEETLLDDDEEVDSIEEVNKVVASLDAARMTSHDVVENCLSENCGAYLCAFVGNKVAPSIPIHLKEIAFICGDLHVRDPIRLNPRSTSLDTGARLIPPYNDTSCLSILGSVDKPFVLDGILPTTLGILC